MADSFIRNGDRLLMFDLTCAEFFERGKLEQKITDERGKTVSAWLKITRLLQPESWSDNFGRDCVSHATTGRRWLAQTLGDWLIHAEAQSVPGFDEYTPEEPEPMETWLNTNYECGYIDSLNQKFYENMEVKSNVN